MFTVFPDLAFLYYLPRDYWPSSVSLKILQLRGNSHSALAGFKPRSTWPSVPILLSLHNYLPRSTRLPVVNKPYSLLLVFICFSDTDDGQ